MDNFSESNPRDGNTGKVYDVDFDEALARLLEMYAVSRQTLDVQNVIYLLEKQSCVAEEEVMRSERLACQLEEELLNNQDLRLENETDEEENLLSAIDETADEYARMIFRLLELIDQEEKLIVLSDTCRFRLNSFGANKEEELERACSLKSRVEMLEARRHALKKTNVLNDAFHIWYDGPFGTISGLRLGRLPNILVEWSEINAAWGQIALVLVTLARDVHFSFTKYRIIPQGSLSKMAKIGEEGTHYDLFVSTEGYGGLYFRRSFSNALVCILYCMKELGDYAVRIDPTMQLPFPIKGHTVGGLDIRTGGSEEKWTRALKNFFNQFKMVDSLGH